MDFGRKLEKCRMCNSNNLYEFLDLGFAPPSDFILTKEQMEEPQILFPLKVAQCRDCGLTQLKYVVNPKILYGDNYKYESSITETGKKHFFSMADSISQRFGFGEGDLVVDIGSNVGVLLEGFRNKGLSILGIDPAPNIVKIAKERGIETWETMINPEIAMKVVREKGQAKVISATNVFAHIDNKEDLLKSINIMLHEKGIFVIEAPYLVDLIENVEYDTMYLEHLEYISIKPLIQYFRKHNMDVFDVERNDIHGKSVRIFICKASNRPISKNVQEILELENEKRIYDKEVLDDFSRKVKDSKNEILRLLNKLKNEGKRIIGISAPAKSSTILNYCKIDSNLIEYMTEKSKIKPGHFTPGMNIPILNEGILKDDKPDYGIIFAWNFAPEIIRNNKEFAMRGGKFIILIPHPKIYSE